MDQDRIDVLLARCLAGELTPEENEELEWAMLANPALRVTVQVLQRMRQMPVEGTSAEEQGVLEKGLLRLKHESLKPTPADIYQSPDTLHQSSNSLPQSPDTLHQQKGTVKRLTLRRWMSAAAVLLLGVAGVMLYKANKQPVVAAPAPIQEKEIATRYGTRVFQELPDGSKLWLNAGSKVKYAESFSNGRRELTLEGEAFFDVKHDPDHPFIIHTGKLNVKVLGTSFNIKAYPNDSTMETTLINGKVEIDFLADPRRNIVLQPNEKVVIPVRQPAPVTAASSPAEDHDYKRKMVEPDPTYRTLIETSWVEDKLVFRNETFSAVSMRLERWYNIHFSFEDKHYLQDRLTGYFKDQPIKNVMDALQISLGFKYRIDGDTIHIR